MDPTPPPDPRESRGLLRLVLAPTLTLLFLSSVLLALHHSGLLQGLKDPKALQRWIQAKGFWAPLVFVGLLALRPFTLVPSLLFSPVAFALFGPYLGTLYKVGGETLGASLAFLTARHGFRGSLGRLFQKKVTSELEAPGFRERFGHMLARRGFFAVLALRVNLLIPFDAINYGLGLTRLRLLPFALGTLIGIVPGTYFYVAASGAALAGDVSKTLLLVAGILLMLLLSVPLLRELRPSD
jgi:uncharacterized membrane protein YdjX (TVP38/TMEM64 family)